MKIDAAYSQVCYPPEVNPSQRAINNHPGSQENQAPSFGNFSANLNETPMATGQPKAVICTIKGAGQPKAVICSYEQRPLRGFVDIPHRHNSFYASFSGNYDQMMEGPISNNHSSEHDTFTTLA